MALKSGYAALLAAALGATMLISLSGTDHVAAHAAGKSCDPVETGIALPPGFCATIFADDIGHARHLAVAADGTVYVNSWSGRYYRNAPPLPGGFLIALRDINGDGRADMIERFGPTAEDGNAGGTGIAVYRDGLYAETNDRIVRYQLTPGRLGPASPPATILSGLPLDGDHPMHPFAIDAGGQLFVNSGSATNNCEVRNRQPGSKGFDPCGELTTRAGIWLYRADREAQTFSAKERYATGIRNTGGISFDSAGRMFAVQHGRDQLAQNWPGLYTSEQGAETPAEELISPVRNADFGWPYCYYDGARKARMLAPEYGGDGKTAGRCAARREPVATFPAHWAPNAVLVYGGSQFPRAYHGGVFIAFHGSWNRAPSPQDGYAVVFQPLRDGRPAGNFIRFADGFAGPFKEPGRAAHRPSGLAMGPDGALYIADDVKGRIWRIVWQGASDAPLAPAGSIDTVVPAASTSAATATSLPAGFTADQVALGRRIFQGEIRDGTCSGCHGSDGRGSSAGPSLTGPKWIWADGSVPSLARVIAAGVPEPGPTGGIMPPRGGVDLTEAEVQAVAAYVWTLRQQKQ